MVAALLFTLREGIGAFVVAAVVMTFLQSIGSSLASLVRLAVGLSIVTSVAAAMFFALADNQAVWEGLLALAGALGIFWLALRLRRLARRPPPSPGVVDRLVIVLVTVLLITRGGMEIGLFIGALVADVPSSDVLAGALSGLGLSVAAAMAWSRIVSGRSRVAIAEVTGIFLALLLLQLVGDGIHEIAEANVVAGSEGLRRLTVPFSSDGIYGERAPFLLLALPLAWLLVALFWGHAQASDDRHAQVDR